MSLQALFVVICVLLAIAFMARKVYRTLQGRASCSCDCEHECSTHGRGCSGGAECPGAKTLREIQSDKK